VQARKKTGGSQAAGRCAIADDPALLLIFLGNLANVSGFPYFEFYTIFL